MVVVGTSHGTDWGNISLSPPGPRLEVGTTLGNLSVINYILALWH